MVINKPKLLINRRRGESLLADKFKQMHTHTKKWTCMNANDLPPLEVCSNNRLSKATPFKSHCFSTDLSWPVPVVWGVVSDTGINTFSLGSHKRIPSKYLLQFLERVFHLILGLWSIQAVIPMKTVESPLSTILNLRRSGQSSRKQPISQHAGVATW